MNFTHFTLVKLIHLHNVLTLFMFSKAALKVLIFMKYMKFETVYLAS